MLSRVYSGAVYGVNAYAVENEVKAEEAAVAEGIDVYPVRHLREAIDFLSGNLKLAPFKIDISIAPFSVSFHLRQPESRAPQTFSVSVS